MADSSQMQSSDDVLKQIAEQTSALAPGEPQTEVVETQPFEEAESVEELQAEEEQPVETSETTEETQPAPETTEQTETPYRIKHRGKELDIPPEKVRDYIQKGFDYETKMRELKEKEQTIATQAGGTIDFAKANEQFVEQLQKDPLGTLMQFTKMVTESSRQEEVKQRRIDRAFEKEMSANIPHWDAIADTYREYRDEGKAPETAVALAEADLFKNLFLASKQKGVEEGERKATLKQKAEIPVASKKGATTGAPAVDDLKKMTSDQLAKSLGLTFKKYADW